MAGQYNSAYTGKEIDNAIAKALSALQTAPVTSVNGKTGDVQTNYAFEIAIGVKGDGRLAVNGSISNIVLYDAIATGNIKTVVAIGTPSYGLNGQFLLIGAPSALNSDEHFEFIGSITTPEYAGIYRFVTSTSDASAPVAGYATKIAPVESGTKVTQYTGKLLASGWAADSYGYQAQTITISGLKASYDVDPEWDVALSGTDPDADAALLEGFALIHNYKTGANKLTAQCIGAAPTVNIPVKVVVFG